MKSLLKKLVVVIGFGLAAIGMLFIIPGMFLALCGDLGPKRACREVGKLIEELMS